MTAPAGLRLDTYVLGQVVRRANDVVLHFPEGPQLTGAELLRLTGGYARRLTEAGVEPGDRVVVAVPNHPDVVASWLAISALDAVVVSVPSVATSAELAEYCHLLDPKAAVVGGAVAERFPPKITLVAAGTVELADSFALAPSRFLERELDTCVIRLSSGTTGAPRPLSLSHRSMVLTLMGEALELGARAGARALIAMPMQGAGAWFALALLAAGAEVTVLSRPSSLVLADVVGMSHLVAVPELLRRLVGELPTSELSPLTGLVVVATTSALDNDDRDALEQRGALVFDLYGSTETELLASRRPGESTASAFFNAEIDAGYEGPAPIRKRGPDIYMGVWPAAHTSGEPTWVSTGDEGTTLAAGVGLTVAGRVDDVVVIRGNNVRLAEVERALRTLDTRLEIAVVAERTESAAPRLVAYVAGGRPDDLDRLRSLSAEQLSPYKQPDEFVLIARLPRNQFGKVERRRLTSPHESFRSSE